MILLVNCFLTLKVRFLAKESQKYIYICFSVLTESLRTLLLSLSLSHLRNYKSIIPVSLFPAAPKNYGLPALPAIRG